MKLTCSNFIVWSMRTAIDVQRTHSADSFPAIMVKSYRTAAFAALIYCNRIISFANKLVVKNIHHFKE